MIVNYREYLKFLDNNLAKKFEAQKPFIKCTKGCAHCCKYGEYPISELEYIYMMFHYENLDNDTKTQVKSNIKTLLANNKEKMYQCPFLVDDSCSIYQARGIICRTFGLLTFDKNEHKKAPFCVSMGLNYSNVYDEQTKTIIKNADDGTEPEAYNLSREVLRSTNVEKEFDIYFGEDKALVDWLKEDTDEFI